MEILSRFDSIFLIRPRASRRGGWGRTASVRPQSIRFWGLAALDPSHPPILSNFLARPLALVCFHLGQFGNHIRNSTDASLAVDAGQNAVGVGNHHSVAGQFVFMLELRGSD